MNQALQGNLWGKMNPETLVHKNATANRAIRTGVAGFGSAFEFETADFCQGFTGRKSHHG
uniref:Uncharacterized protein n=1 Tax=mine drainage metagenome TaxID=410659 RepID=E6QSW2_9ZZZZ